MPSIEALVDELIGLQKLTYIDEEVVRACQAKLWEIWSLPGAIPSYCIDRWEKELRPVHQLGVSIPKPWRKSDRQLCLAWGMDEKLLGQAAARHAIVHDIEKHRDSSRGPDKWNLERYTVVAIAAIRRHGMGPYFFGH